jgi:tyrosyl-tRNA synthetase
MDTFKKGQVPDDMPEFPASSVVQLNDEGKVYLPRLLASVGFCKSAGEGRRLLDGGGVKVDGVAQQPRVYNVDPEPFKAGAVVQSGKKHWARLV